MWSVCFIVISGLLAVACTQSPNTLQQVHVVHRHGARNALVKVKSDPNVWSQGLGQLRPEGMRQMYDLGRFLRQRYTGFLSEDYVPSEVYMRSTDVDRTLMSAECSLAGLYVPKGEQVWNPDIQWQPVPVHTVDVSGDVLLWQHVPCPKYDQLFEQATVESTILKENEAFLRQLERNAGWSDMSLFRILDNMSDLLFVEASLNRSMPEWVTPQAFQHLMDLRIQTRELENKFPLMTKLRVGTFMRKLLDHLSDRADDKTEQAPLMYIYSTHDYLLAEVLFALQCWNNEPIPYAAAIIFELHQQPSGEYMVRSFYKNDTVSDLWHDPYPLKLPSCSVDCPLRRFRELVAPMVLENSREFHALCVVESVSGGSTAGIGLLSLLGVVIHVCLTVF